MRLVIALLLACACGLLQSSVGQTPATKPDAAAATQPQEVLTGAQSRVQEKSYFRISSQDEWKKVWQRHAGDEHAAPQVDFERSIVVAIFQGRSVSSRGLRIESMRDQGESILLRFDDLSYQTSADWGKEDHGNAVTVWAFVVIARTDKPIVLEEDVNQYLRPPPVWKQVARLP